MFRTIRSSVACAVLASLVAAFSAQAMPFSAQGAQQELNDVTPVAGGCGPGFHRGLLGACVANGPVIVGPAVVVAPPVVVAPGGPVVVVAPPVVCGAGFRWHPRFRRCVVL